MEVVGLHDGIYHSHDSTWFVDVQAEWIDRRALERAGWIMEDVDAVRGEPFERALHPQARHADGRPFRYPMTVAHDGDVVQIVYVPVGAATRTWANRVWSALYPRLYRWFVNDEDLRASRCHGIVFLKSDF
jgi:hypothetical protein